MPEQEEFTEELCNYYITMQVMLPMDDGYGKSKVIIRNRGYGKNPIGVRNNDPLLYYRVYTVEFYNGKLRNYSANFIAEIIYVQVDSEVQ